MSSTAPASGASAIPFWHPHAHDLVVHGDNLAVTPLLPDGAFRAIYLDPPFNTGRVRKSETVRTTRPALPKASELTASGLPLPRHAAEAAAATEPVPEPVPQSRVGFKGRTYETVRRMLAQYDDVFADYWAFLEPRLEEAWRLLADDGTLYLHLDYREVHYAKVVLDALFGRECFLNEIIWAYDYGARSRSKWPTKHENVLVYVKDPDRYVWNGADVDREPYMAPGLVTPEKAALGKLPTDVWWHTIVSPTGKERTGYPTQKPVGIVRRMIQASTNPGDWVLDAFAGSGTAGVAARMLGRRFVLIDDNDDAVATMRRRFDALTQTPDADGRPAAPVRFV